MNCEANEIRKQFVLRRQVSVTINRYDSIMRIVRQWFQLVYFSAVICALPAPLTFVLALILLEQWHYKTVLNYVENRIETVFSW
jgi:hypothetical protein